MDVDTQEEIRLGWENAYRINNKIKAHAIGGIASLDAISKAMQEFVWNNNRSACISLVDGFMKTVNSSSHALVASIIPGFNGGGIKLSEKQKEQMAKKSIDILIISILELSKMVANSIETIASLLGPIGTLAIHLLDYAFLGGNIRIVTDILQMFKKTGLIYYFMNKNKYKGLMPFDYLIEDDIMIDLESQTAKKYTGIKREIKVYRNNNINLNNLASTEMPGIPHNLAPFDADNINYIINNIDLNDTGNKFEGLNGYKNEQGGFTVTGVSDSRWIPNDNKILTIPSTVNGLKVTEIANFALSSDSTNLDFSKLENIVLPDTIEVIGNNAFSNNPNLKSVNIPERVYSIGEDIFENSNNIENINVSSNNNNYASIDGNLYDKEIRELLLYAKGNKRTTFELPNTVILIKESAVSEALNLEQVNLNNVRYIEKNAFFNASNLSTITGGTNLMDVNSGVFEETKWLKQQGEYAKISGMMIKYNGTESLIDMNNFPSGINRIADDAFSDNIYIEKVILTDNIISVGQNAFANNENLKEVIFLRYFPTQISYNTFINTHEDLVFKLPNMAMDHYLDSSNFPYQNAEIKTIETSVDIVIDETEEIINKTNMHGEFISKIEVDGYNLNGYKDSSGKFYAYDDIWDKYTDTCILTAVLSPINYLIIFDLNSGTMSEDYRYYNIKTPTFNLPIPTKKGYKFLYWKNDKNEIISKIYNGTIGNDTFYAFYEGSKYEVSLDSRDGILVNDKFILQNGKNFSLPIPTKLGYTFGGWYYKDIRLTTNLGESTRFLEIEENITMYAQWILNSFEITFDANGLLWVDSISGFNNNETLIEYKSFMQSVELLTNLFLDSSDSFKEGYRFLYFTMTENDRNSRIINWEMLFADGIIEKYKIYPYWEKQSYTINFEDLNSDLIADFDDKITLPVATKTGYKFIGWQYRDKFGKMNMFSDNKMPDLSIMTGNDISSITLSAYFIEISYGIYIDTGEKIEVIYTKYGKLFDFEVLESKGKKFLGLFTLKNGIVVQYVNEYGNGVKVWDKDENDTTLYVHWQLFDYSITYNLNGGDSFSGPSSFSINSNYLLEKTKRLGYEFTGWYDQYGQLVTRINKDLFVNIDVTNLTLAAGWYADLIVFSYLEFDGGTKKFNNRILILDFRGLRPESYSSDRRILQIEENVESLTLIGDPSKIYYRLSIEINGRYNTQNKKLTINLINMNYEGTAWNSGIWINGEISAIDIYYKGNNSIIIPRDTKWGTDAINTNTKLTFIGSDGTLRIQGGLGRDGANGVKSDKEIKDGAGGAGVSGPGGHADHGVDGTSGNDGNHGGNAVYAYKGIEIVSGIRGLELVAGHGGRGGHGGDGTNGGNGGKAKAGLWTTQMGGNGGNGGHGGNGGNAGRAGQTLKTTNLIIHGNVSMAQQLGNDGFVGVGGIGGIGHINGKEREEKRGSNGTSGSNGRNGTYL